MPQAHPPAGKHEAILDAALKLFAEQGFHGVTVPEVASAARVGTGTIYRYFPSKEALVNQLFRHHKMAMADALLRDLPSEATPRQLFHVIWTRAIGFAREQPEVVRFLELHHHGDYLDAGSRELQRRFEGLAFQHVERSQRAGALKNVAPGIVLALLWGGFAGALKLQWDGQLVLTEDVLTVYEQCLWEAIRL